MCSLVVGGLTVATRYVKAWVDQDNRRYYDIFGFRLSQTVTMMISYDMPHLRTDVRNATKTRGRRFLGASSLNAPGARPESPGEFSGVLIDVVGSSLGSVDLTARVKLGSTGCEESVWRSSTAVACWAPRGADRGSMLTAVTVGERLAVGTAVFSYDAPTVSQIMMDLATPVTSGMPAYS